MTEKELEAMALEAELAKLQKRSLDLDRNLKNPSPDENKRLLQMESDHLALVNLCLMLRDDVSRTLQIVAKTSSTIPSMISSSLSESVPKLIGATKAEIEGLAGERKKILADLRNDADRTKQKLASSISFTGWIPFVLLGLVLVLGSVCALLFVRLGAMEETLNNTHAYAYQSYFLDGHNQAQFDKWKEHQDQR